MATRLVFSDEDGREMDCYLNNKGKVFIEIAEPDDDVTQKRYITLDKIDVKELIGVLTEMENHMED
jgi:hypothetical protein